MESVLSRINSLLAEHPASEVVSGVRHEVVSEDGEEITLLTSFSDSSQQHRSVVLHASLQLPGLWTEEKPQHGRGRVLVPCLGKHALEYTRNSSFEDWRFHRKEDVFVLNCAPDATVIGTLAILVREWLATPRTE